MPRPATKPLEVYCNVLASVGASLLVCYPELRGVRYSWLQFIPVCIINRKISQCKGPTSIKRRCQHAIWSVRYKRFHYGTGTPETKVLMLRSMYAEWIN